MLLGWCLATASKRDPDREVQPQLVQLVAPGEVDLERADRAAPAQADAIAQRELVIVPMFDGAACVDEHRTPQCRQAGHDGPRQLGTDRQQRGAADRATVSAHRR